MVEINAEIVKKSIARYKASGQINVAIEEMSELTKELCKALRSEDNREKIVEELADVLIMMENVKRIFWITDDELNEIVSFKQNRLVNRMEGRV